MDLKIETTGGYTTPTGHFREGEFPYSLTAEDGKNDQGQPTLVIRIDDPAIGHLAGATTPAKIELTPMQAYELFDWMERSRVIAAACRPSSR